jgi:uncharacterized protein YkwD
MRFVASIMVILYFAALTGCGSGGSGSGSATDAAPSNNTDNVATGPGDTAGSATGTTGVDDIRDDMLTAINQARSVGRMCGTVSYGAAAPVTWNDKIATAAFKHSNDMAANGFLSHTGSDGSLTGDRLVRDGYVWSIYGENIAVGYSSVAAVVQGWLGSEDHCANIMNPAFHEIGAAYAKGAYQSSPSKTFWTLDLASTQ